MRSSASNSLVTFESVGITRAAGDNEFRPQDPVIEKSRSMRGTSVYCHPGVPCEYPDEVDVRIIILTFERWESLLKLLNSVNDLYMDGDIGSLEIWVDRRKNANTVSEKVIACAESFSWKHGSVRVHVQEKHVGILGQWIDTWRPRNSSYSSNGELVLILEDDMSLSPYAYRWLRAAHRFYDNNADIAGITLQSEGLIIATSSAVFTPMTDAVSFYYSLPGSWGFAPHPVAWRKFQDWYHRASLNKQFHPYVKGLIMTHWFKMFEKKGTHDSMWTMWFIYFSHENKLYTLYSNLNRYTKRNSSCLTVNRREAGLHYKGKSQDNTGLLLRQWSDDFIKFNHTLDRFEFTGKQIEHIHDKIDGGS